jgi:hypothetical protein
MSRGTGWWPRSVIQPIAGWLYCGKPELWAAELTVQLVIQSVLGWLHCGFLAVASAFARDWGHPAVSGWLHCGYWLVVWLVWGSVVIRPVPGRLHCGKHFLIVDRIGMESADPR